MSIYYNNKDNTLEPIATNVHITDQPISLNGLSDTSISNPSSGQVIKYNGTEWVNGEGGSSLNNIIDSPTVGNIGGVVENSTQRRAYHQSGIVAIPNQATGDFAHAEGVSFESTNSETGEIEQIVVVASGTASHAEGVGTTSSGECTHAEGNRVIASGDNSHAEGYTTTASGDNSHAEGCITTASGDHSHASGYGTRANYECQTVVGKYNNNKSTTYFEVGNGSDTTAGNRSNAFEVYLDGFISQDNGVTKYKFGSNNGVDGYWDINNAFHKFSGLEPQITISTAVTEYTLNPNTFYVFNFDAVELDISTATITDNSVVNEFHFSFKSGSTATEISFPLNTLIPEDFSVSTNTMYEISIVNNCMIYQKWSLT